MHTDSPIMCLLFHILWISFTNTNTMRQCLKSTTCDILCDGTSSCQNITINATAASALFLYAQGSYALDHATIICPSHALCSITIIGSFGGQYARIFCGNNSRCAVIASAHRALYQMSIYAQTSSKLTVRAEGGYESQYASIYCPRHQPIRSKSRCIIQLASDPSSVFIQGPIMSHSAIYIDSITDITFQCDAVTNFAAFFDTNTYSNTLMYHDTNSTSPVCYITIDYDTDDFYSSNQLGCVNGTNVNIFSHRKCNPFFMDVPKLTETQKRVTDITTISNTAHVQTSYMIYALRWIGYYNIFWILMIFICIICCLCTCLSWFILKEYKRKRQLQRAKKDIEAMVLGVKPYRPHCYNKSLSAPAPVVVYPHSVSNDSDDDEVIKEHVIPKDEDASESRPSTGIYHPGRASQVTPQNMMDDGKNMKRTRFSIMTLPTIPSGEGNESTHLDVSLDGDRPTALAFQEVNNKRGNCAECGQFKSFGVRDANGFFYCSDCWHKAGSKEMKIEKRTPEKSMNNLWKKKKNAKKKYQRAQIIEDLTRI